MVLQPRSCYKAMGLFLLFGIHPDDRVKRAKTHQTGKHKHRGYYKQYNAQGSAYYIGEVEYSNQHGGSYTQNFVGGSHVWFHNDIGLR
jgi:hypothetical protein